MQHALWSDLFTGRLKTEIPDALVLIGIVIYFRNRLFTVHLCRLGSVCRAFIILQNVLVLKLELDSAGAQYLILLPSAILISIPEVTSSKTISRIHA